MDEQPQKLLKVSVCIPAYKRPTTLRALLCALEAQRFEQVPKPLWDVVIVDNDAAESARPTYREFADRGALNIRYITEKKPGTTHVINTAFEATMHNADLLCVIDDDEVPCEHWLDELLRVQSQTKADCVCGPVRSILPLDAPAWVRKGQFFATPDFPDAQEPPSAGSGNMLVTCAFLRRTGLKFDPGLGLTGGADSLYFMQAKKQFQAKIVWAAKAFADEYVSPNRATVAWLIRRTIPGRQ